MKSEKAKGPLKFGWITGVYIPCLLNIWGVMLFLRLSWVIGQTGLVEGILLILVSNCVTTITTFSMSAVSTNGQIKGGGIYYMISRSLGPEFGGAVGLMFTLASSIAVAMYVIGFCESLLDMVHQYLPDFNGILGGTRLNDVRLMGSATLVLILVVAVIGMALVNKIQIGLLFLLIVSQLDFMVGSAIPPSNIEQAKGFVGYSFDTLSGNLWSDYQTDENGKKYDFFSVFAVFFPAVTGIAAGANMSGDLKDPGTAIPKGTLLAIGTTLLSYIVYGAVIASASVRKASGIPEEVLHPGNFTNCQERVCKYGSQVSQQMMQVMSFWGPLIYAGCFAATLSSAIASLVGGPRVFQAVSKDKLFPGIACFSKGWGKNNDPIRAYMLVFLAAAVCIAIGDLNFVSSLLSNFFVATYAIINYAVFHASVNKSPGWRPSFKYYNKWISLLGSILCVIVMIMMDFKTALATFICMILLYIFVKTRSPNVNWGSSSQSQIFLTALKSVQNLAKIEDHVKNYRPKVIVMSGSPSDRPLLIDFAHLLTKRLSLLELVHIVNNEIDLKTMQDIKRFNEKWLAENHIKAFYALTRNASFSEGVRSSIELSGLGKLSPNLMLIGFQEHWWMYPSYAAEYFKTLQTAFDLHLSVCVLRVNGGFDISEISGAHEKIMEARKLSDNSLETNSGRHNSAFSFQDDGSPPPDYNIEHKESYSSIDFKMFDIFRKKTSRNNSDIAFGINDGNPIDERILHRNTQFRDKIPKQGFIDVYWLYDDGGLTLLLPYILMTRTTFSQSKLRIFIIASPKSDPKAEAQKMASLLAKFRIEFEDVILLTDVTRKPSKCTKEEFSQIIKIRSKPVTSLSTSSLESMASDCHGGASMNNAPVFITEDEMVKNMDKTNFHLKIAEIARENSDESALVIMTLPLPKSSIPHSLYLAWLDFTTRNMPPFLFVRGNQESVLTFYS